MYLCNETRLSTPLHVLYVVPAYKIDRCSELTVFVSRGLYTNIFSVFCSVHLILPEQLSLLILKNKTLLCEVGRTTKMTRFIKYSRDFIICRPYYLSSNFKIVNNIFFYKNYIFIYFQ